MGTARVSSTSPTGRQLRPRASLKRSTSFPPPGGPATYRDLLRFEQRLIQNAEALAKQRRKYQVFLGALVCSILLLGYKVLCQPSIYSMVHYSQLALLLIATTALVLFFATGMYSTKIARGYKFVPQANRSLRPLNMHLATSGSASSTGVFSSLSRSRSHRRLSSETNHASTQSSTSPPPLSRAGSSNHPLSELIFSSRVDPEFQRGYQEFRAEWERRKASKKPSRRPKLAEAHSDQSSRQASFQYLEDEERGRVGSRADSAASSPGSSRSPSPSAPHSRFTSSTSLSSAPGPTTPPDESDLELADLVDDHIKGVNKGRRTSRASSLAENLQVESDDDGMSSSHSS